MCFCAFLKVKHVPQEHLTNRTQYFPFGTWSRANINLVFNVDILIFYFLSIVFLWWTHAEYCTVTYQHRHWLFLPTVNWCWCRVAMVTWCRCVTSWETSEQQIFHWDSLPIFYPPPPYPCFSLSRSPSINSHPPFLEKRSSTDQRTWTEHLDEFGSTQVLIWMYNIRTYVQDEQP